MRSQRTRAYLLCLASLVVAVPALALFGLLAYGYLITPDERQFNIEAFPLWVIFVLVAGAAGKLWQLGREAGAEFDSPPDERIGEVFLWGAFVIWWLAVAVAVGFVAVTWL